VLVVVVVEEVEVATVVLVLIVAGALSVCDCAAAGAVQQSAALIARATESGTEENGDLRIMVSLLRSI
jgi:hypothetical protein